VGCRLAEARRPSARKTNALRSAGWCVLTESLRQHLLQGHVIPAHPLALDSSRRLDERHQRALTRYYLAAGAGGVAVGVHTTQFEIREPRHGLYEPVLTLAAETVHSSASPGRGRIAMIAGVIGNTKQATREATIARDLGYDAVLLSLGAMQHASEEELVAHCREIADIAALFGFYLQPAVGGRRLSYRFWRDFVEIDGVVAIKIAPFDRYETLSVLRAVADAGRTDIALYTGNDDNIIPDLVTRYPVTDAHSPRTIRIIGGLLGHWAVWTSIAVDYHRQALATDRNPEAVSALLALGQLVTEMNAAIFDPANGYRGCLPGIHEVLTRQGLMKGPWCLDPSSALSKGQGAEIDRVLARYPELTDDAFIAEHRDEWLR
jgi:dihydrodipicolinate synthase/N-acetylneuraminate lyase